tara:strand:+ start:2265 stop:3926 length:1662 start_codon:yes stop_codon:yes gene_type:complete
MTIKVQDLSTLTVTEVQQAQEFITQLVQEQNASVDAKRGVLHDLLFYFSGVLSTANQTNIDRYRKSNNLKSIEADPTLADADVVDNLLSNYGITRREGTTATGTLTIVVSALSPVTIPNGGSFTADGKSFSTSAAYLARTEAANVVSDTDRLLTVTSDGNYSFTIPVVAAEIGAESLLAKDTLALPSFTIVNFVKSFASATFVGGVNVETNKELIARLNEGIAAKAMSNRINMSALLKEQVGLENIVNSSIIGYGDKEMLRDQHSIFPLSFGGRVDWYIRTEEQIKEVTLTKTASLVQDVGSNRGSWQLVFTRDDVPGFYDVVQVAPSDSLTYAGTFKITEDSRGTDLTNIGGELVPDITSTVEGVYSRFQTASIRFTDDVTDTSTLTVGTSTKDYSVVVRYMPLIKEAQTFASSRNHRNYAGDLLIKAPIPCFVGLSFVIRTGAESSGADLSAIKSALSSFVNTLGFCGRLPASALNDVVYNYLVGDCVGLSSINMTGSIRKPDGTISLLSSDEVLIIPDEGVNMVTGRTTAFFLSPSDIAISEEMVDIPEI